MARAFPPKKFLARPLSISQPDKRIHRNFNCIYRFHKIWMFSNNYSEKIHKFLSNMFRFLGKKNVDIFENSIHFRILCIVWKNETSLPSGGPSPPVLPAGARDSFLVAGASPPPEKKIMATPLETLSIAFVMSVQAECGLHVPFAAEKIYNLFALRIGSRVGKGEGTMNFPPPPKSENCCRNLMLSSRWITSGEELEIQDIFSKKCEKSVLDSDFDQKIAKFSWNFS